MEQTEVVVAGPFRCADWRVEPERLLVIAPGGSRTRLSPKAMGVLQALAARAPQVVRRRDLMEIVWPRQDVGDGVLAQALLELRHAFDDDAREPRLIETIRGVGVRLMVAVAADPDGEQRAPGAPSDVSAVIAPGEAWRRGKSCSKECEVTETFFVTQQVRVLTR